MSVSSYAVSESGPVRGTKPTKRWLYADVSTLTTEPSEAVELTAADRCDACGAQGYVRVTMPFGELIFCAHHGRKHAHALAEVATHIQDESDRLHAQN